MEPIGSGGLTRNRGERDGKQVVQVYAERADSAVERPAPAGRLAAAP